MINFPSSPIINAGGLASFFFTPVYYVLMMPVATRSIITGSVSFRNNTGWLTGHSSLENLQVEEVCEQTLNGHIYKQTIKGFMPGASPELIQLFDDMALDQYFFVSARYMDGSYRLFGLMEGLEFSFTGSSGSRPGDAKGYTFEFSGTTVAPAPVYRGQHNEAGIVR